MSFFSGLGFKVPSRVWVLGSCKSSFMGLDLGFLEFLAGFGCRLRLRVPLRVCVLFVWVPSGVPLWAWV